MTNCGVCSKDIRGMEARKCPKKKCKNLICLICDPLETKASKVKGGIGFLSDLVQGDVDSLVYDDLSKRVRCSTCTLKDKNQDRWIIAAVVALLVGFFPAYLIQWILEGLLNANIGGIGSLTIFTIIFIPAIIYIKKMMG